jgi:hypothetical protein
MFRVTHVSIVCAAVVLLAACQPAVKQGSSSQTATNAGQSNAGGAKHSSFGAQPISQPPPVYPPSLVESQLKPLEIRAKLIVDEEGRVSEVRDLYPSDNPTHAQLFAAVHDAATQWRFSPMTVVEQEVTSGGVFREISRQNKPFSLDFAFRFEVSAGGPTVSSAPMKPSRTP